MESFSFWCVWCHFPSGVCGVIFLLVRVCVVSFSFWCVWCHFPSSVCVCGVIFILVCVWCHFPSGVCGVIFLLVRVCVMSFSFWCVWYHFSSCVCAVCLVTDWKVVDSIVCAECIYWCMRCVLMVRAIWSLISCVYCFAFSLCIQFFHFAAFSKTCSWANVQ